MARQKEQWELEFRVGPGETDGRRGMRVHRQNVDPNVAEWFRDLVTDPAYPIDPRAGGFFVYINGTLASSIVAGADVPTPPTGPTDLARIEQLRTETVRLEGKATALSAQVSVDEHRLKTLQADLLAYETRIAQERDRVTLIVKACDDEIEAARRAAAEEKRRIADDLRLYRDAMVQARADTAAMFEHLRTAEIEEVRLAAKRRIKAQEQLTAVVEECAEIETRALQAAMAGGNRPSIADQASRLGIDVEKVTDAAIKIIGSVRGASGE